jgi:nitrite reductase (NADH) small subunit/3-phenylpropionate/trans-cinnamate dioxygenase ferredoxin subunit
MSEFETVAKVGDIPNGEGRAFEFGDNVVAIFNDNETYRAIDDMCPHMGASLATGFYEDGEVSCPWHAWRFDTRDGAWCDNRRIKIAVFQVRVVGDEIQVAEPLPEPPEDSKSETAATQKPFCDGCQDDTKSGDENE